jgi:ATPase subunit of ABC transporter with duplicated ATPase domains
VLVVTHDRAFLDRAVTRVYEPDGIHDQLQVYEDGYREFRVAKARRWESYLLAYEAQEKHRRKLAEDIERTKEQARAVEASTNNDRTLRYAKKVARQALSRERRLEREMRSARWLAAPQTRPSLTLVFAAEAPLDEPVVEVREPLPGSRRSQAYR